MTLITTIPALQARSMLRYAAWRRIVAEFAARRLGQEPDDLVPETIAHVALGTSMAAFLRWVSHPCDDLQANLRRDSSCSRRASRCRAPDSCRAKLLTLKL
jgi:TetR/AcrR family transcriptional regulator, regulator of mycofactocin system